MTHVQSPSIDTSPSNSDNINYYINLQARNAGRNTALIKSFRSNKKTIEIDDIKTSQQWQPSTKTKYHKELNIQNFQSCTTTTRNVNGNINCKQDIQPNSRLSAQSSKSYNDNNNYIHGSSILEMKQNDSKQDENDVSKGAIVHHAWHCGIFTQSMENSPRYWNDNFNCKNRSIKPKLTIIEPKSIDQILSLSRVSKELSGLCI